MLQSNRPYSYINVFDNLRKKIPKGEYANKTTVFRSPITAFFPFPIGMDDDTHAHIPIGYRRIDPHVGPFIDRHGRRLLEHQSYSNPGTSFDCSMHRLGDASLHRHPAVGWPPFRGTWVRIELLVVW